MNKFIVLCLALVSAGCVSGTVDVDEICTSHDVTLPGLSQASMMGGTVQQSVPYDFSDTVSKIDEYGSVTINRQSITVGAESGSLDFLDYMKISATTGSNQTFVLVDSDVTSFHGKNGFPLDMKVSGTQLVDIMKSGSVELGFVVSGMIPPNDTKLVTTICVGVTANVSESVL